MKLSYHERIITDVIDAARNIDGKPDGFDEMLEFIEMLLSPSRFPYARFRDHLLKHCELVVENWAREALLKELATTIEFQTNPNIIKLPIGDIDNIPEAIRSWDKSSVQRRSGMAMRRIAKINLLGVIPKDIAAHRNKLIEEVRNNG